jgi:hypothetical protein
VADEADEVLHTAALMVVTTAAVLPPKRPPHPSCSRRRSSTHATMTWSSLMGTETVTARITKLSGRCIEESEAECE